MADDEAKKAKSYIRKWQGKQRQFVEDTGRYRKYERESITQAR